MTKKKTSNRKKTAKKGSVKGAKKKMAAKPKTTAIKAKKIPKKATVTKAKKTPPKKGPKASHKVVVSTPVVDYARATLALDKYGDQLRGLGSNVTDKSKVTGVSIGPRFKQGELKKDQQNEMVIRLEVATKEDKEWLKDHADEIGYQKSYDGVDTDLVVWNFKTSSTGSAGSEQPDGTAIQGPGGRGTLGTKVVIRLNGRRTAVWMTAGHVASIPIPFAGQSVNISKLSSGALIGTVSQDHYFRDKDGDVAFIVPIDRLSTITPIRIISPPKMNLDVTMKGGVTTGATGKIISMSVSGQITSPGGPENVVDHCHVQGTGGNFAVEGDSGGIVVDGDELIGIVRASDTAQGIAVVTRLDNLHGTTLGFDV